MNQRDQQRVLKTVQQDPTIQEMLKHNPIAGVALAMERSKSIPNTWPYRTVIIILGIITIGVIGAVILFAVFSIDFPSEIIAMASTAIGGLVGILAPSPNE